MISMEASKKIYSLCFLWIVTLIALCYLAFKTDHKFEDCTVSKQYEAKRINTRSSNGCDASRKKFIAISQQIINIFDNDANKEIKDLRCHFGRRAIGYNSSSLRPELFECNGLRQSNIKPKDRVFDSNKNYLALNEIVRIHTSAALNIYTQIFKEFQKTIQRLYQKEEDDVVKKDYVKVIGKLSVMINRMETIKEDYIRFNCDKDESQYTLLDWNKRKITSILHKVGNTSYFQSHKLDIGTVIDLQAFEKFFVFQQMNDFNDQTVRPDFFKRIVCSSTLMTCKGSQMAFRNHTVLQF